MLSFSLLSTAKRLMLLAICAATLLAFSAAPSLADVTSTTTATTATTTSSTDTNDWDGDAWNAPDDSWDYDMSFSDDSSAWVVAAVPDPAPIAPSSGSGWSAG
jgi:hypothetical protein